MNKIDLYFYLIKRAIKVFKKYKKDRCFSCEDVEVLIELSPTIWMKERVIIALKEQDDIEEQKTEERLEEVIWELRRYLSGALTQAYCEGWENE